jgi:hypothetical protein
MLRMRERPAFEELETDRTGLVEARDGLNAEDLGGVHQLLQRGERFESCPVRSRLRSVDSGHAGGCVRTRYGVRERAGLSAEGLEGVSNVSATRVETRRATSTTEP